MSIRKPINVGVAVLFAAQVPLFVSLIQSLPLRPPWISPTYLVTYIFAVALGHALLLGLPIFLFANWKGWVNVFSSALAGFATGSIPVGILFWPSFGADFSSINGVPVTVDGVTTLAGWLNSLKVVSQFGILGATGGLGFWLVVRWGTASPSFRGGGDTHASPSPMRSRTSVVLYRTFAVSVMALSVGIVSIPIITKDRSCHNVLRDGRVSVGPEFVIDLRISDSEWPVLITTLQDFAADHDLSFRDDSVVRDEIIYQRHLSLCTEAGVTINAWKKTFREVEGEGQSILFYLMKEDADWQGLANELIMKLNTKWPDRVQFENRGENAVPTPDKLTPD